MDSKAVMMNKSDGRMQFTQTKGDVIQLAGFVGYHGALSDLESSNGTNFSGFQPGNCAKSHHNQLTLFYAGTVNVFDNVTAKKAELIMSLAGGGCSFRQAMDMIFPAGSSTKDSNTAFMQPFLAVSLPVQDQSWTGQSNMQESPIGAANFLIGQKSHLSKGSAQQSSDFVVPYQAMVPKALPLARKESLARFLQKRKERNRLIMNAPYSLKGTQPVGCCSKKTTQMLWNGLWSPPSIDTCGVSAELFRGVASVEEHDLASNHENMKQVLARECAI